MSTTDMTVIEFVGILVIQCPRCGEKYVVNSQKVRAGFVCNCKCGKCCACYPPASRATVSVTKSDRHWKGNEYMNGNVAMPIDEYRTMLADCLLTGKKQNVPKRNKNVVSFEEESKVNIVTIVDALRRLGFTDQEARTKVKASVAMGMKNEEEIIKYIMAGCPSDNS